MSTTSSATNDCCDVDLTQESGQQLKKVLWAVLLINLAMFVIEITAGFLARSNALLADSLDMLGDTFVYGVSIAVLTHHPAIRAKASFVKGATMSLLGLYVVGEIIYKLFNPLVPQAEIITTIGVLALGANALSFALLLKYKNKDLNARSAWICSRNDVIANISVIGAGILVARFNSMWPDIIIGFGIAMMVLRSSLHIMQESLLHQRHLKGNKI